MAEAPGVFDAHRVAVVGGLLRIEVYDHPALIEWLREVLVDGLHKANRCAALASLAYLVEQAIWPALAQLGFPESYFELTWTRVAPARSTHFGVRCGKAWIMLDVADSKWMAGW